MDRFERILFIHSKLSRKSYPTQARLACELEVSDRTIRRDLEYMKSVLGAPLFFDEVRRGYTYGDAVFALPASLLSCSQLQALLLARRALERDNQAPWYAPAKMAFDRILESLPAAEVRRHEDMAEKIAFAPQDVWSVDGAVWKNLLLCIEGQESAKLTLKSCAAPQLFDPYRLIVQPASILLHGWCHARKAWAQIALSEIISVEFSDRIFDVKDECIGTRVESCVA
ncbi:MAG TPA: HTH domain-containing protein [Planctomycetota bacterium]|nr:HTH domain-containing protein [Planctomycetota bacterium]